MKEYLRLILILLVPLLLVYAYSMSGYRLVFNGWTINKVNTPEFLMEFIAHADALGTHHSGIPQHVSVEMDDMAADTTLNITRAEEMQESMPLDTCSKRILFFGDSMVEGLSMRFADYAMANGHLLYSACWYGSTTGVWASSPDSISKLLHWAKPDYVVVSLGGNELKASDVERRRKNILTIQKHLGTLPTVWIAPPSWIRNPTITGVIQGVVGNKRYFDSTRLKYTRGRDRMHPTFGSSSRWMDSIAVWMSSPMTAHPIRMNPPTKKYPRRWNHRIISPN